MTLFVDLDGVLADLERGHEIVFGRRPSRERDDIDWPQVFAYPEFFRWLPPIEDAHILWGFVRRFKPTILTGIPKSYPQAAIDKRDWVSRHLGPAHVVPVICCRSADKALHAKPGDILIDDWDKYRHKWIGAGGIWIQHNTAEQSIRALQELFADEHLRGVQREF